MGLQCAHCFAGALGHDAHVGLALGSLGQRGLSPAATSCLVQWLGCSCSAPAALQPPAPLRHPCRSEMLWCELGKCWVGTGGGRWVTHK